MNKKKKNALIVFRRMTDSSSTLYLSSSISQSPASSRRQPTGSFQDYLILKISTWCHRKQFLLIISTMQSSYNNVRIPALHLGLNMNATQKGLGEN